MSNGFTPEEEKKVRERLQEREKQVREQGMEQTSSMLAWQLKIMKEHFGEEVYQVLVKAIGEGIRSQWSKKAEEDRDNSIEALIKLLWEPLREHGFEYTQEEAEIGFQMNCTKCPHYELAKRHGITEQMFYMVCEGDHFIAEGFNPNIGFKRTKTLMQGDDCCDHFYYYKDKEQ
jgi:predicted ArsR family transcriptional regulator